MVKKAAARVAKTIAKRATKAVAKKMAKKVAATGRGYMGRLQVFEVAIKRDAMETKVVMAGRRRQRPRRKRHRGGSILRSTMLPMATNPKVQQFLGNLVMGYLLPCIKDGKKC